MGYQNQMKLSQLRILVAVAARQNFTDAALDLQMSQSAVSHAIAMLEQNLGVVLFSRGRHGARLTPLGERIVEHAQEIVHRADEIAKEAELSKGLKGGQVRIASFRSIATHILPGAIAHFHQQFPAISVNLAEHEDYPHVEHALREGQADIGFTFMPASEGLEVWEVIRDEFVALLPITFQPAGSQLSWEELVAQPLIMPPVNYIMMRQVYQHAQTYGYALKVTYEVETDATIVSLVAQGLGAAILPRLAAEPIPAAVRAYSLPVPLERVIGVATLADALLSPAIYAFLDSLKTTQVLVS
ncbi:LysR family transcriptional regulator [Leptolyngbya sp. NM3-A1]|uniref:LysR family transcriptional regulator n=2 Tax=unclassified Leptolyngbya TaxID=2650499 RepID=UPI0032977EA9